ncbi:WhiB family transcriptional regulator [Streptomyces sp. CB03234]|uniref:WhiB family transcriptional regulator n=1 Tax=Streptomyces sp. (strain CB03234) TaxID=1703937 RepID=UPI00093B50E0|nr:WhiB family transcriptional regulator [Streptomyces sp. CB03234]
MSTDIRGLIEAAYQGDWSPLIEESKKAPGKHWAEEARCSNQDIDIFVPLGDGPREDPDAVKSKLGTSFNRPRNLCASCPLAVAARCLVESLKYDDEFGIRAGLLASERSALRAAWHQRVNEETIQRALRGCTAVLNKAERDAVIARFAADPSLEPTAVARGLGVTHDYLLKLARRHRQKSRSWTTAPLPVHSADAA